MKTNGPQRVGRPTQTCCPPLALINIPAEAPSASRRPNCRRTLSLLLASLLVASKSADLEAAPAKEERQALEVEKEKEKVDAGEDARERARKPTNADKPRRAAERVQASKRTNRLDLACSQSDTCAILCAAWRISAGKAARCACLG